MRDGIPAGAHEAEPAALLTRRSGPVPLPPSSAVGGFYYPADQPLLGIQAAAAVSPLLATTMGLTDVQVQVQVHAQDGWMSPMDLLALPDVVSLSRAMSNCTSEMSSDASTTPPAALIPGQPMPLPLPLPLPAAPWTLWTPTPPAAGRPCAPWRRDIRRPNSLHRPVGCLVCRLADPTSPSLRPRLPPVQGVSTPRTSSGLAPSPAPSRAEPSSLRPTSRGSIHPGL